MAVLCGMPTILYSARSACFFKSNDLHISTSLSSVMTAVSRDSIVDRHWRRQRYVPYAINSRLTSQKIWGVFLYGVYRPGEWLWIDSMVKMETRHPVEGSLGNECLSIYNHYGATAAWSCKTLEKSSIFSVFTEKRPLTGKFSKFYSDRIHRNADCHAVFKFCEIWLTEISKIVHTARAWKWIQYLTEAQLRAK